MEMAEFIIKMGTIIVIIFGVLTLSLQDSSFTGYMNTLDAERAGVEMAHAVSAASCLADKVGGELRKGVLLAEKLNSLNGADEFPADCISLSKRKYSIEIIDIESAQKWTIGSPIQTNSKTINVVIKYPDRVSLGRINTYVR